MPVAKTTEPSEERKVKSLTVKMSFEVFRCTLPNICPCVAIEYSWALSLSQNHHVPELVFSFRRKRYVLFVGKLELTLLIMSLF